MNTTAKARCTIIQVPTSWTNWSSSRAFWIGLRFYFYLLLSRKVFDNNGCWYGCGWNRVARKGCHFILKVSVRVLTPGRNETFSQILYVSKNNTFRFTDLTRRIIIESFEDCKLTDTSIIIERFPTSHVVVVVCVCVCVARRTIAHHDIVCKKQFLSKIFKNRKNPL